jgi:hypothetical protein
MFRRQQEAQCRNIRDSFIGYYFSFGLQAGLQADLRAVRWRKRRSLGRK